MQHVSTLPAVLLVLGWSLGCLSIQMRGVLIECPAVEHQTWSIRR